jgi:hypothetical protein
LEPQGAVEDIGFWIGFGFDIRNEEIAQILTADARSTTLVPPI